MRAAVITKFGNSDVFEVQDIKTPVPRKDEVLIEVYASSINPVDYKMRNGNWKFIFGSNFPIVLGFDVAGKIVECGSSISKFKVGDDVWGRITNKYGGAYAEYALAKEIVISNKPTNLSFTDAASIPLAAGTALQALRDYGKIKTGSHVLINGATGGVGQFAIQIAKIFGAEITAVSSSIHKEFINQLEPDHWIDYRKESFTNHCNKYDIIFDVAGKETFLSTHKSLKKNGIYITSLPRPKVLAHKLFSTFTSGKKVKAFFMKPSSKDLLFLKEKAESGELTPHVDSIFGLDEIARAHEYAETSHLKGKVVIQVK